MELKNETRSHLEKAADLIQRADSLSSRSDDYYHKAADEIIAAKAVEKITLAEIALAIGKSISTVERLLRWHREGRITDRPDWASGTKFSKKELDDGIDKYFKEASPEELLKRLGAGKVAEIVGSSDNVATVIVRNDEARNMLAMANLRETMRSSGGGSGGGGSTKNPIAPKLPPVPLPIKLGYIATKVRDVATEMALTYKDDAPLASEDVLEQANHVMTQAVRDFEEIIESALDGTFNIRRATDASS